MPNPGPTSSVVTLVTLLVTGTGLWSGGQLPTATWPTATWPKWKQPPDGQLSLTALADGLGLSLCPEAPQTAEQEVLVDGQTAAESALLSVTLAESTDLSHRSFFSPLLDAAWPLAGAVGVAAVMDGALLLWFALKAGGSRRRTSAVPSQSEAPLGEPRVPLQEVLNSATDDNNNNNAPTAQSTRPADSQAEQDEQLSSLVFELNREWRSGPENCFGGIDLAALYRRFSAVQK
ncbi:unnamed protein product [Polarella glacialis]|uniref:Uncharacterized protein n=1 Tax=Polarella glacialis TaxID=89957 RepID=A0A813L9F3_POLGL|nr:unnamed protein product [Polarella glacialis]